MSKELVFVFVLLGINTLLLAIRLYFQRKELTFTLTQIVNFKLKYDQGVIQERTTQAQLEKDVYRSSMKWAVMPFVAAYIALLVALAVVTLMSGVVGYEVLFQMVLALALGLVALGLVMTLFGYMRARTPRTLSARPYLGYNPRR